VCGKIEHQQASVHQHAGTFGQSTQRFHLLMVKHIQAKHRIKALIRERQGLHIREGNIADAAAVTQLQCRGAKVNATGSPTLQARQHSATAAARVQHC
jgi:hypothetical protein